MSANDFSETIKENTRKNIVAEFWNLAHMVTFAINVTLLLSCFMNKNILSSFENFICSVCNENKVSKNTVDLNWHKKGLIIDFIKCKNCGHSWSLKINEQNGNLV
jgi:DNA-directed RNA polymerase subunit M/transcription elongation factor TFIIS